jgi:hypothetical protein
MHARPRARKVLRRGHCAALDDGTVEEAARSREHEVLADGGGARTLPKDGHASRVAAKRRRVAAHPAQRRLLIEQTLGVPRANRGD